MTKQPTGAVDWYEGSPEGLLLLGHATGFCRQVWRPVVEALRVRGVEMSILAWDARGHGDSPPLSAPVSWWTFGHDLIDLIDDLDSDAPLVGVGHSMGGVSVVMAEVLRPGVLAGMVLIEPVMIPPPFAVQPDHPLAVLAAKRRAVFPSRSAAAEAYRAKPLFRNWHPDAFAGYLEGGLRSHPEGVSLALPPFWEAAVFAAGAECGIFDRMGEVSVPVRLLISDDPGLLAPVMPLLSEGFPDVTSSFMTGQNHMVVMERPDLVAEEIAAHLQLLGSQGRLASP